MGAGNFIVSAKKEKVNFIGGDIEPNLVNFVKDKLLPLEYQLL
jgi:DNA modification methylase